MGQQYVAMHEAHLRLRQGDLPFARVWAEDQGLEKYLQEKPLVSEGASADVIRDYELLIFARILIAAQQYDQALVLLDKLLPALSKLNHPIKIIEAQILIGIARDALGQSNQAIKSLKTALNLAGPANFLRVFLDEGDSAIRLIEQIHEQGFFSPLTQKILTMLPNFQVESTRPENFPKMIEPLSEREIEILHLLVSRLSVPEIAKNIHISVSTLRTHIRNIYRKLDTHSRHETVSKAQELGII